MFEEDYYDLDDELNIPLNANVLQDATPNSDFTNYKDELILANLPRDEPIEFKEPAYDEIIDGIDEVGYGGDNNVYKPLSAEDERQKILQTIEDKISTITGFDNEKDTIDKLKQILFEHWQAFALPESKGRMSDLSPIQCVLKSSAPDGLTVKNRAIGNEQTNWLKTKIDELTDSGIIAPVKHAEYCSQSFVVNKKGPARFRMVVDMKPLNSITVKTALQLPLLEHQLHHVRGAKYFACYDIKAGYDFLRTATSSQKYFNLVMPWGQAYKMIGTPQGWTNSPMYYQDRMVREVIMPTGFYCRDSTGILQWIDDSFFYIETLASYLIMLTNFLKQLIYKKVRLSIHKCTLLSHHIDYCGRHFSAEGWNFMPVYYEKILKTNRPRFHHELAEAIYLATWLQPAVPHLIKFRNILSEGVNLTGKIRDLKRANLLVDWTEERSNAWTGFLSAIAGASKRYLSLYDPKCELNIFTDASKFYWSAIVTQCNREELLKDKLINQCHKPLMFFSGRFDTSQIKWHVSQKELYPILLISRRIDFLIYGHSLPTNVFTDHRNLLFILHPSWSPSRSHVDRLHRWNLRFQEMNLKFIHIQGIKNTFADLLSRWGNEHSNTNTDAVFSLRAARFRPRHTDEDSDTETDDDLPEDDYMLPAKERQILRQDRIDKVTEYLTFLDESRVSPLSHLYRGRWKRVSVLEIIDAQRQMNNLAKQHIADLDNGIPIRCNGKILIPWALAERVIIHNHLASNHGTEADELRALSDFQFIFPDKSFKVENIVRRFRQACLHCPRPSRLIRRPRDITVLPTKPRDVLMSDYLYINKKGYILTLVDCFSRKTLLKYAPRATTAYVVEILLEWRAHFGLAPSFSLHTDRGSHFCSILLEELSKALGFTQNYAISYCPWTNGGIEVSNRRILSTLRALTSQYQLSPKEWPILLPTIMHLLNNRGTTRNKGFSPNEILMGKQCHKDELFEDSEKFAILFKNKLRKPTEPNQILTLVDSISEELEKTRGDLYPYIKLLRLKRNKNYNTRISMVRQYQRGDWVLLSNAGTHRERYKYKLKWTGPHQISESISPNVYKIQLLDGKEITTHAARLELYEKANDEKPFHPAPELLALYRADAGELEVEKFLGLRRRKNEFEVKIRWLGFGPEDDTWEPVMTMADDLPVAFRKYLDESGSELAEACKDFLQQMKVIKLNFSHVILPTTPSSATKWLPLEEAILKKCILKYGVGNYKAIHDNQDLPGKNTQQLYTKTQKILGKQSIAEYSGLKLRTDRVFADNYERYGVRFYIEKSRIVPRSEVIQRWFFNRYKYSRRSDEEVLIPFFRRSTNIGHVRQMLEYLVKNKKDERKLNLIVPQIVDVDQEIKRLGKIVQRYSDREKENILFESKLNLVIEKIKRREITFDFDKHTQKVNGDLDSVFEFVKSDVASNMYMIRQIGNEIRWLADRFIAPPKSVLISSEVQNLDLKQLHQWVYDKYKSIDILVLDPPWQLSTNNPTRGPALNYKQMKNSEIFKLNFSELLKDGYLFCWMINSSSKSAHEWLYRTGFTKVEDLIWVKVSKHEDTNRQCLTPSIGRHLLHAKEICTVWKIGNTPTKQISMNFGVDVILEARRAQSQKPERFYQMIEKTVPGGTFIEFFARCCNVRTGWISTGIELPYSSVEVPEVVFRAAKN